MKKGIKELRGIFGMETRLFSDLGVFGVCVSSIEIVHLLKVCSYYVILPLSDQILSLFGVMWFRRISTV